MAREKDYNKLLENWPYEYCRTTDAIERRVLLNLAIERGIDPDGNKIRMMLWNRRHPDAERQYAKGKVIVDEFLKAWMALDIISADVNSWFGRKKVIKETKKQLEILGKDAVSSYGKLGEQIYYEEMYQLTYLYMRLCEDDRNYNTIVMGVGKLKPEEYANKVAQNIYRVCYKLAIGLEMQEEFSVFQKAAQEAFYDMFPRFETVFDNVLKTGVK